MSLPSRTLWKDADGNVLATGFINVGWFVNQNHTLLDDIIESGFSIREADDPDDVRDDDWFDNWEVVTAYDFDIPRDKLLTYYATVENDVDKNIAATFIMGEAWATVNTMIFKNGDEIVGVATTEYMQGRLYQSYRLFDIVRDFTEDNTVNDWSELYMRDGYGFTREQYEQYLQAVNADTHEQVKNVVCTSIMGSEWSL